MGKLVNRAKMTVSGTPLAGTITLGSAVTSFMSFAAAGIVDGDMVSYAIEDGTSWELGEGLYTASGTTLARTTIYASSNSNAAISAGSSAMVFATPLAQDLPSRRNMILSQVTLAKLIGTVQRGIARMTDGFKDAAGYLANGSGSTNVTPNTTVGYVTPTTPTISTATPATTLAGSSGYTFVDIATGALTNGATITSIGIYSTVAYSGTLKVLLQNSSTSYTVVVSQTFTHGGGGWQDFTLTTPYAVPGTGTYLRGVYTNLNGTNNVTGSQSRAYIIGDQSISTTATFTQDTFNVPVTRATYQPQNITLVSTAQTADSPSSYARAAFVLGNNVGLTAGTDFSVRITTDGGAHWTAATPVLAGAVTVQTGAGTTAGGYLWEIPEALGTSGSSVQYEFKTLTNKAVLVYSADISWR